MTDELPEFEVIGGDVDTSAHPDEPAAGTELWFSRRLAEEHGDGLKYVWEWRAWMAWHPDQGRWKRDAGAAAWSAAKTSVQRLLKEAGAVAGHDEARGKMLLKAARRFMGRAAIESALKLAQSSPGMIATADEWDARPHLLNCSNGTVDLRTGKLHPHDKADRLTKTTGVRYDPDAPARQWDTFLERILPDSELRDYLQRAIGYAAIGNVTEHLLHVLWGGGANGKSVFCGTIERALGEYAVSVPPTLLVSAKGFGEHPTIRTILHGARFALASETAEDGRFDEAALKVLTGGDTIRARGMRENWWEFPPSHALFLQTNHRPRVREMTVAFWRRLRLVPFTTTIPAAEQDKKLASKLATELPGILAWIVTGAAAYERDGLNPPAVVQAATNEYQQDQDTLREFVEMYEPGGFTSCKLLHERYEAWAQDQGLKPWGQRTLTGKLKDRGWDYLQRGGVRGFKVCCTVPERNSGLVSREDTRVRSYTENTVSNGTSDETPHSKPFQPAADDSPNGASDNLSAQKRYDAMNFQPIQGDQQ